MTPISSQNSLELLSSTFWCSKSMNWCVSSYKIPFFPCSSAGRSHREGAVRPPELRPVDRAARVYARDAALDSRGHSGRARGRLLPRGRASVARRFAGHQRTASGLWRRQPESRLGGFNHGRTPGRSNVVGPGQAEGRRGRCVVINRGE